MACADPQSSMTTQGPVFRSCGQCLPCRIKEQSALTFRCLLENQNASSGYFLTLTYEEEPEVPSYAPMQMFLDRLRSHQRRQGNFLPIRYLAVGEFGDVFGRFHFHALIFNSNLGLDPAETVTGLWRNGYCVVGNVSPASIRYTCRYTTKFLHKEEDRLPRGRSQRPPLGEPLMRSLGEEALRQGHTNLSPPSTITWGGKIWPLDTAMQIAFMEGANPSAVLRDTAGTRKLARSVAASHLSWMTTCKLGDPFKDWREHRERQFLKKQRDIENGLKL